MVAGAVSSEAPGSDPSSDLMDASDALLKWIRDSRAPRGCRAAEAELGAVAGVYRNAVAAFRSLSGADDEQRVARASACASMLGQGGHHVEAVAKILAQ